MTPMNAADDEPREPRTSLLTKLLKAVEVALETEEATKGTSDSRCLEAHDHVLMQRRRERRSFSDILSMFELPEGAEERGTFEQSAPVVLSKTSASWSGETTRALVVWS
jgi:hypothetical protein